MGLDLDQVATTLTLFFYIGGLDLVVEGLRIGIVHPFPIAEIVVVICDPVHNNSGRARAGTLPVPF